MAHKVYNKVVLVVLDGFGVASYNHGNAVALASPEVLNDLVNRYVAVTLLASGPVVGLPWGEVGNSEVGHLNMGAGRIVGQDLPRINSAIQDRTFFSNPAFLEAINHVKQNNSKLHLMGMISGGGVHSSDEHMYALLGIAAEQGLTEVYIHMFTDGRDTGEKVAMDSLTKLKDKIRQIGVGEIATVTGRFYAMDRARHWDQTEITYNAMVYGQGSSAESAEDAVLNSYTQEIFDEMIHPTVIIRRSDDGGMHPVATVGDNDSVIFTNFRSDRALQLTEAFVKPEDMDLPKKHAALENLCFVTMSEYRFGLPVKVAFPPANLRNNLSEIVSGKGLKQFHIAESEKYAHVTSFFNGGRSEPLPNEERKIIASPENNRKYDEHPEMSGLELTEVLVEQITKSDYNFYLANFANPDMVGHTGNLKAAIKAVQYIDRFLRKIADAVLAVDGVLIITGDHGNIEQMMNLKTGEIDKEHSTNPVPFIIVAQEFETKDHRDRDYLSLSSQVPSGIISDIAPTVLELFGFEKPPEMNSRSLLAGMDLS
jgi:2,3-bisphosphoglycerate-independent phosphoglycerate mutase